MFHIYYSVYVSYSRKAVYPKLKNIFFYNKRLLFIGALKIALEAKLKKQALYSKEGELELQVQTLHTMKKNLKTLDKYPSSLENTDALLRFLDDKLQSKTKKHNSYNTNSNIC